MKKIDSSLIVAGKKYRPTKKGLDFLQAAYTENFEDVVRSTIGDTYDPTIGYVMHGCVLTLISGSDYSLTAGAIFFNGEIYRVDAILSITITDIDSYGILTITVTNDPVADPSKMTDDSYVDIHNIRKLVLSSGAIDSGDINFKDLIFISSLETPSALHYIGATDEPAFENGFVNMNALGITYNAAGYTIRNGMVHLFGDILNSSTPDIATVPKAIFTLPSGDFPPAETGVKAILEFGYYGHFQPAGENYRIIVDLTSGAVQVQSTKTGTGYTSQFSLNGISFPLQ